MNVNSEGEQQSRDNGADSALGLPATSTRPYEEVAHSLRELVRDALETIKTRTKSADLTEQQQNTIEESLSYAVWLQLLTRSRRAHFELHFFALPFFAGLLVCVIAFFFLVLPPDSPRANLGTFAKVCVVVAGVISAVWGIGMLKLNLTFAAETRELAAYYQLQSSLDFLELLNVVTLPGPLSRHALSFRGNTIVTRLREAQPHLDLQSRKGAHLLSAYTTQAISASLADHDGAREKLTTFAARSMIELAAGSLGNSTWLPQGEVPPIDEPVRRQTITPLRTLARELARYSPLIIVLVAAFWAIHKWATPFLTTEPWKSVSAGVGTVFATVAIGILTTITKKVLPEAQDAGKSATDLK